MKVKVVLNREKKIVSIMEKVEVMPDEEPIKFDVLTGEGETSYELDLPDDLPINDEKFLAEVEKKVRERALKPE
jgi:hypothetical protein